MRNACHQPICSILPPHVMKRLADSPSPVVRGAAFDTVRLSERLRGARLLMADALRAVPRGVLHRSIYDARNTERLPGTLVRDEGGKRSRDAHVNDAYDGLGATFRFYQDTLDRTSLDGQGEALDATVHYGRKYMNAFWDGHQMVFGDGDGEIFGAFTSHLDVIGHELTHGVISHEAAFEYEDQPGALNESFADVFGSLVLQYASKQSAKQASWRIGQGLLVKFPKQAIRSLAAPGTAYDNDLLGKDPQPSHLRDYRPQDYPDDNGGVHVFSGIPNHAFYLAAMRLGGNAWERAGRIWYLALTDLLSRRATFADAALATVTGADRLFGAAAGRVVRQAWSEVGVEASAGAAAQRAAARPRRQVA
jgi:Zn-dependent metalloprotease